MNPLGVGTLDHVSVLITDVARSRRFYGDVLGLTEVPGPKEFDFVVVWYALAKNQYLHLLLKPQPDTLSPRHFALTIPDAISARAHFARYGIRVAETVKIAAADRFFVSDPDGNRIELICWDRSYNPATDGSASPAGER